MDIVILTNAIQSLVPNKPFTVYWENKEGSVSDFQTLKFEDETVSNPSDDEIVAEYNRLKDIEDAEVQAKADLKASVKAKLIAGEALTEEEANTIVL